jgi:poly(A) polymerase
MTAAATFSEDASRRDFTLNAMAMDADGHILDPENGQADITAGLIRAVGDPDARLAEDPLRTLRAVRFAVQFGFCIDGQTREALAAFAPRLPFVAVERQTSELMKMASLPGPAFSYAVRLLGELGILKHLLPEVQALSGLDHDLYRHPAGDVFTHTLAAVAASTSREPAVNLAILFHDIGKTATLEFRDGRPTDYSHEQNGAVMTAKIGERLRFPAKFTKALIFSVANHLKGLAIGKMKPSKVMKLVMDENWPILKEVLRCDCAALCRAEDLQNLEEMLCQAERTTAAWREQTAAGSHYMISGQRVLELTGLAPGPCIGEAIRHVTDWAMDHDICALIDIEEEVMRFVANKRRNTKRVTNR